MSHQKKITLFTCFVVFAITSCNWRQSSDANLQLIDPEIVSSNQLQEFGYDFYIYNLNREDFGFDMISRIYPNSSKLDKHAMVEAIKENDELKIQILYSAYRYAIEFNRSPREDFGDIIYRMTHNATMASQLSKKLFDYFQQYESLNESEKTENTILYKPYIALAKRSSDNKNSKKKRLTIKTSYQIGNDKTYLFNTADSIEKSTTYLFLGSKIHVLNTSKEFSLIEYIDQYGKSLRGWVLSKNIVRTDTKSYNN